MGSSFPKPKAVREGYSPRPFFFEEEGPGGEPRLVAWTDDLAQLARLVDRLLAMLPEHVEILVKIERDESGESPEDWDRYFAACPRAVLLRAIMMCDALIFRDSRCQLMVRDPESHEYVVVDEVGVVYVYSTDGRFRQAFTRERFENREEELVSTGPHWRQCVANGDALARQFILEIGAHPVDRSGEPQRIEDVDVH